MHSKSPKAFSRALRQQAEAHLKRQAGHDKGVFKPDNTKRLLHELQVHETELEMQNEELQRSRLAEIRASERYTELFEFAPVGYFVIEPTGRISQLNLRGASLLGVARTHLVGQQFLYYVTEQSRAVFRRCLAAVFEGKGRQACEISVQVNARSLWFSIEANLDSVDTNCLTTVFDITDRKLAEERLKLAASVFTHARESICITDAAGVVIDVNDTFSKTTGYSRDEIIGQNRRILESKRQPPAFYADRWQSLLEKYYWYGEVWNRNKNGSVYPEMETISAIRDERGVTTHYVTLGVDVSLIKEHHVQLEHIANYDVLTDIPNRSLLVVCLSKAMLQCRSQDQSVAVVYLDIDGFKEINEAQGHDVGDKLLIELSVRMKDALREGDTLARLGGDEFVAVLADLVSVEDCEPVLDRLLLAASEPFTLGSAKAEVSASIGVTLYPQDGADAEQLIRHADQAMYVAKQAGKNCYRWFDAAQDEAVNIQQGRRVDISAAFERREFVLHYQPKVNMHTGEVIGVEALIRWQHPVNGLLPPIDFLPIIEGQALSLELGEWVIDTALTQISQWQNLGIHLPISVNISAYQLQQDDFVVRLEGLLAAHPEVQPSYLELEILETSAISNISQVSATMGACHDLGVQFALDDFGTGYSSLTYLRRLPAHLIKIDQTFVRDMLEDPDDLAIVDGVIGLAQSFKREVIAEGVETLEHGVALLKLGCELAQGYGIAKPMPATDMPAWLNNWKPDTFRTG